MTGIDLPPQTLETLLSVNVQEWQEEVKSQGEFLDTIGSHLPIELRQEHDALAERLL